MEALHSETRTGQDKSPITQLTNIVPLPDHPSMFVVKGLPVVGRLYKVSCPTCASSLIKKVAAPGLQKWVCPKCKSTIFLKAAKPMASQVPTAGTKPAPDHSPDEAESTPKKTDKFGKGLRDVGQIEWGTLFNKKKVKLRLGTMTIGRRDAECPSDIQIDDKYVSRRSATIDVTLQDEKGYFFKFAVNHATNPVLVNGVELAEGQSVYLAYDDVITMGKTHLSFKKSKQS